jgi:hypothetical protein
MELSKPPKDVLALGKYLERELKLADSVDTLGRWMSHHLADLIHKAENGKTSAERTKAQNQAVETILKIWEHRKSLPRNAYPLAGYADLLKVVDRMRFDNDPYRYYGNNFPTRTDEIAAALFQDFARLIPLLLLRRINILEAQKKLDSAIVEALDGEEQSLLSALHEWLALFPVPEGQNGKPKKKKTKKTDDKFDLIKAALEITKRLKSLLDSLEDELAQH